MKPTYYLFTGYSYYPSGGMEDLAGIYESLDDAKKAKIQDWAQIAILEDSKLSPYLEWRSKYESKIVDGTLMNVHLGDEWVPTSVCSNCQGKGEVTYYYKLEKGQCRMCDGTGKADISIPYHSTSSQEIPA